ncbi:hypothetical protein MMYC01_204317 [Madurella mycetomatis]|uniref:peptidylprolyl isomerase n=1 Tax=Madurella mycetomatis TaxID=100816 RepID=A0A175W8W5_9PEZI|nr:hypothetical protein MMYC01_204317 [Madurella mycetomatis]
MSPLLPVAVYGLEVPSGEVIVPAENEFPATIRITMAAIDPTAEPETDGQGNVPSVPRSTLKIIKTTADDDEEDEDYLESLLGGGDDDEDESEEEDEEANGGPSDPSKSKKARREAAIKKLLEATKEESDDEMEDVDAKPNGAKSNKGKGKSKASDEDDEESDEEDDDGQAYGMETFVVCTLDTERNYQQPLDITIGEGEKVFFSVKGTHKVYLTGNYVIPEGEDEDDDDEDSDDEYDLPPGIDDMADEDSDEMSDELDDIDGLTRIKEIDTDEEEEAPKLVDTKKGKNKRPAEDEAEGLDEMISKEEKKLSKKQLKKLKNNQGEPVTSETKAKESSASAKGDKKVQFAKDLEQGPTGSAKDKADKSDKKATLGVKVVQGVTVDDRKIGSGRTVKSGDKVGMRYIGKLQNGKVFDSNKKGAPFTFKIGKGEVIKGWDIGIMGMSVGGERRLTIPSHLGYGSRSMPGIPANSTLIFDVKLVEINPSKAAKSSIDKTSLGSTVRDANFDMRSSMPLDPAEIQAEYSKLYRRESEYLHEMRKMKTRSLRALPSKTFPILYLVMEYMSGGDFLALLVRENMLDEVVARFYTVEIILCVEAAHSLKWIYRDIKPGNFLIPASGHLELSDFGLASGGHWSHDMAYYNTHQHNLLYRLSINIEGDERDKAESRDAPATTERVSGITASIEKRDFEKHDLKDLHNAESLLNCRKRCGNRTSVMGVVGTSQHMAPKVFSGRKIRCSYRLCSKWYCIKDLTSSAWYSPSAGSGASSSHKTRGCDFAGRFVFPCYAEDTKAHKWYRNTL